MRFQVPQFTEIEDKIFGPLSLKQFIYLVGGAGGIFVLYGLLPLPLVIFFGIPIALFSLALAFYKVNNQPFVKIAGFAFKHFTSNRLYLWKKREMKIVATQETEKTKLPPAYAPKLNKSRLDDLAWSLDIKKVARIGQRNE